MAMVSEPAFASTNRRVVGLMVGAATCAYLAHFMESKGKMGTDCAICDHGLGRNGQR